MIDMQPVPTRSFDTFLRWMNGQWRKETSGHIYTFIPGANCIKEEAKYSGTVRFYYRNS